MVRMPIGPISRCGLHWRKLASTIEQSVCGGDATFLMSNCIDHFARFRIWPIIKVWLVTFRLLSQQLTEITLL